MASARRRRGWTQERLALKVGISRSRLAELEAGGGATAPSEVWFALGEALGIYLRFEFGRDPQAELRDAGHLAMQELVLRATKAAGWAGGFEIPTKPSDPARSIDVPLLDRAKRRFAIVECWNTFGDLGAAARSSDRKLADAQQVAANLGRDGGAFEVGLCWVVRDTAANRTLLTKYQHIFQSRFPGSSSQWLSALTTSGAAMPHGFGIVWCDLGATRLFALRWR